MLKVFTSSNPREVIEEMNRRLKKAGLPQVNNWVNVVIRKRCKYSNYRIYDSMKFLLSKQEVKRINLQCFICFQIPRGKTYYKETSFNPRFTAVLVDERGTIYRYIPNYQYK